MTTGGDEPLDPNPHILGALLGWEAFQTGNGIVLRLETAISKQQAKAGHATLHDVALNVRQMRALAHNISHLADEHEGITRPAQKKRCGTLTLSSLVADVRADAVLKPE